MVSRANKGAISEWWWTVDHVLILLILILMFTGVVLAFAASPPIATDLGLPPYYFVQRQAVYLGPAILVIIGASFLTPRQVRRVALVVLIMSIGMLFLVPFLGAEVKGARRWLSIAGQSIQPSEFVKPAFVIIVAWLFSESARHPETRGNLFAVGLLGLVVVLLVSQPDIGQTILISIVWCALFFLAGMPWVWIGGLGATGILGLMTAYFTVPHVASRIDGFINPEKNESYQINRAIDSIKAGGWLGKGPGEGTIKDHLPDAHTDFIFAVAVEEFGIMLCMLVVWVFAAIVIRALVRASGESDIFIRLSASGLAVLFGIQSCINLAVNLRMMPAKGMTLPFVSYGGSSIISLALGMGLLLALTRRRPRPKRVVQPVTFEDIDPAIQTSSLR